MKVLPDQGYVTFGVKDKAGDQINVVYRGAPPGNMGTATQVVAVGGVKEGVFEADRIVLKCPSKYEADKQAGQGPDKNKQRLQEAIDRYPDRSSTTL